MKKLLIKYREIILYLFFGVVTTVVSLLACALTLKAGKPFLNDGSGNPSVFLDVLGSIVQWVTGVLVAFFTNKFWVFGDKQTKNGTLVKQLAVFSGSRVATFFLEMGINLAVIWLLTAAGYTAFALPLIVAEFAVTTRVWAKVTSSVFVVVGNYFISKFFIFKKDKTGEVVDVKDIIEDNEDVTDGSE